MKAVHIRSIDAAGIYSPLPSSVVAPPIDRPREGDRDRRRRRSLIRRTVGAAVLSPGPTNVSLLRFTALSALSLSLSVSVCLSVFLFLYTYLCLSIAIYLSCPNTQFYHFSPSSIFPSAGLVPSYIRIYSILSFFPSLSSSTNQSISGHILTCS